MAPEPDVNCPFCVIARGEAADLRLVASAPEWIAFFPPEPATPGHTLVVPRVHVANLWEADARSVSAVSTAAVEIGRLLQRALEPAGLNLITSAGEAGEQTVFHLHLHVVPRWPDDRFGALWPPKGLVPRAEIARAFDRVRRIRDEG